MPEAEPKDGNQQAIARRLTEAGMRQPVADTKARWFTTVDEALRKVCVAGVGEPYRVFVPGRIEVLGKHTDYAGGRSLLAVAERGFCMAAMPRRDATIRIIDVARGEETVFEFSPDIIPTVGHWSNYPMTVARRLARNFEGPLYGADIAFVSDLPAAAGMSSSSALMIAVFKVLAHVNRLADRTAYRQHLSAPLALAAYLATIENGQSFGSLAGDRGVGTFGGSEDHTAICCCRSDELRVYSFCPARLEQTIPMPAGHVLAIGASGVLAEKTGEAMARYNRASRLVSALVDLWRTATGRSDGSLADAIRSESGAADRLRRVVAERLHNDFPPAALVRRLDQFLAENEQIIPAAVGALVQGAMDRFGTLVDQSQRLAEELLENQIPQTIRLARLARQHGAAAASAFGAGFGGSVWALVESSAAEEFLARWARHYREEFPAEAPRACFFLTGAGSGLVEL